MQICLKISIESRSKASNCGNCIDHTGSLHWKLDGDYGPHLVVLYVRNGILINRRSGGLLIITVDYNFTKKWWALYRMCFLYNSRKNCIGE